MDGLSPRAQARLEKAEGMPRRRDDWGTRSDQDEFDLDTLFASFFSSEDPAAQRVLKYLESISRNRVLGPDATDAQLRHLEGARWFYGIIDRRIARGRAGPRQRGNR